MSCLEVTRVRFRPRLLPPAGRVGRRRIDRSERDLRPWPIAPPDVKDPSRCSEKQSPLPFPCEAGHGAAPGREVDAERGSMVRHFQHRRLRIPDRVPLSAHRSKPRSRKRHRGVQKRTILIFCHWVCSSLMPSKLLLLSIVQGPRVDHVNGSGRVDDIDGLNEPTTDAATSNAVLVVSDMTRPTATDEGLRLGRCHAVPCCMIQVPVIPSKFHIFDY
jgi:hypothetical protein